MMDVRGVFRSWDTLVMSSALKCSDRIRSSTAAEIAWPRLFSSSAWRFRSGSMWLVSMWYSGLPPMISWAPMRIFFHWKAHRHSSVTHATVPSSQAPP